MLFLAAAAFFTASCGTVSRSSRTGGKTVLPGARPAKGSAKAIESGVASWYGPDFHGKKTANGETYNMNGMTAAHRTLPFDSIVLVENTDNGKSVQVRINDRGPFAKNRIIDLSRSAAREIEMIGPGTARVKLYLIGGDLKNSRVTNLKQANYTIQLGSYNDAARAGERAAQLKGSRVERIVLNGETIYRVYYGLYKDPVEAKKALDKLDKSWLPAFVKQVEN